MIDKILLAVTAVIAGLLVSSALIALDQTDWTEINRECYVREVHHRNLWYTPGHDYTERTTFCRADLQEWRP
jgi:hypothetical protein